MAELDTADREKLDKWQFAYVDKNGEGHLPIHDEAHVRNAIARWNQTAFESMAAKEAARRKILAAARRYGVKIDKGDKIMKPVRSLRAASTKSGPKGGRRTTTRRRTTTPRRTTRRGATAHRR